MDMDDGSLTTQETRIVEILYEDWRELLRCTAIDQAMERAGEQFSHASRVRIAKFLLGDAKADALMRWEPAVYVPTNPEKLVARRILRGWHQRSVVPQPGDGDSEGFALSANRVAEAFETLAWLGLLQKTGGRYRLAANYASFVRGLGFYFHEVVLPARSERFNTNCAPDFFIMTHPRTRQRFLERAAGGNPPIGVSEGMSEKMTNALRGVTTAAARPLLESASYEDEFAILNDACAWSDEAIRIVMDRGRLAEVTPAGTWYLLGGGCGVNNLFRSEEAFRAWVEDHPQFKGRAAGPLADILTKSIAGSGFGVQVLS
jgi:hypothetical protein